MTTADASVSFRFFFLGTTTTGRLDTHRHGDDSLLAPPALLLNHLPFGAPVLEDNLRMAARTRVGMVKTHSVACWWEYDMQKH
jgi:hypothetical protein